MVLSCAILLIQLSVLAVSLKQQDFLGIGRDPLKGPGGLGQGSGSLGILQRAGEKVGNVGKYELNLHLETKLLDLQTK